VRGQRAGNAIHRAAPAVAAGRVFELQQGKVVDTFEAQGARRRQAGDTAAGDQHMGLAQHRGRRPQPVVAHQMAARRIDTDKAAMDVFRFGAAQQRQGRCGDEVAAFHGGAVARSVRAVK